MNSTNLRCVRAFTFTALVLAALTACLHAQQSSKPNIIFILADNVGYGDLGPYGGGELRGAPTPRIDQLSAEGLRLTQFLVEPACTPSRAALMTGRYSIREGLSLILVPGGPKRTLSGCRHHGRSVSQCRVTQRRFSGSGIWARTRTACRLPMDSTSITESARYDVGLCNLRRDSIELTHSIAAPRDKLLSDGPQIVEATAGGPLKTVKPFTPEVQSQKSTMNW